MAMVTVSLTINGAAYRGEVEPRLLLADFIREVCQLTGTHVGCEHGVCGACTILMNGEPVRSCLTFAVQANGADLATVEGLAAPDGTLHPLQEAFREHHGLQCGFCTPGVLMTAIYLLRENPDPHRTGDPRRHRGIALPLHGLRGNHPRDRRRRSRAGRRAPFVSGRALRYLEPRFERASRAEMTRWQTARLREQTAHAYRNSPFYRSKLRDAGVKPSAIRNLADLARLPFTTKDELKEDQAAHPPWGHVLAVPLAEVLRVHLTSATTGRPLAFLDTREDWHGFYHSYARSLYAYGVRKTDMVMAAFSYGPWIGYWSGFYAAQDLGCLVFPVGGLSTDQRIDALLTYPITVLGCTPSYALFLAEAAAKKGIDLAKQAKIRITWHTGEPGASIPATRARIEAAFGGQAFDLPGLTEIAAWGFECQARSGLTHVHEDYCYPEVLDERGRARRTPVDGASWSSRASIARPCRFSGIGRATLSSLLIAVVPVGGPWWPSRAVSMRAWTT